MAGVTAAALTWSRPLPTARAPVGAGPGPASAGPTSPTRISHSVPAHPPACFGAGAAACLLARLPARLPASMPTYLPVDVSPGADGR